MGHRPAPTTPETLRQCVALGWRDTLEGSQDRGILADENPAAVFPGRSENRVEGRRLSVSVADEWVELAAKLRTADNPYAAPEAARLIQLALGAGRAILGKQFPNLQETAREDIVHDLLAQQLPAIVASSAPRAFFGRCVVHAAISWIRYEKVREGVVVGRGHDDDPDDSSAEPGEQLAPGDRLGSLSDERAVVTLDLKDRLEYLTERERTVLIAVAMGEGREELAMLLGTSRANIDQILSRVRRSFSGGDE
jgi:DNA-directed RNA polymerase specialized sigma24 family protein